MRIDGFDYQRIATSDGVRLNVALAGHGSQATWYWSTEAQANFRQTTLRLRQIYPQELPLLLMQNGLELVRRFGGFKREPSTAASWRQVCICELKA